MPQTWIAKALFSAAVCMFSFAARGEDLPKISEHSKQDGLELFEGDTITLEAKVDGKDVAFQWVSQEKVLCKALQCKVETKGWSVGYRNVVFVAQNKEGTSTVTFKIRVKTRPVDHKAAQLKPPVVKAEASQQTLSAQDFFIRSRSGLSFAHKKDNTATIVNANPRPMEWNERFKSSGGVLQFGVLREEEHTILPGSYAYLDQFENRRLVVMEDGLVRSRQLSKKTPQWTIIAGDWLQVDGDSMADVIVNVGKHAGDGKSPVARIVALRGQVRVLAQKPGSSKPTQKKSQLMKKMEEAEEGGGTVQESEEKENKSEGEGPMEFIVPAGGTLLVNFVTPADMVLRPAPGALVHRVISNSSPQYLNSQHWLPKKEGQKNPELAVDYSDPYRFALVSTAEHRPESLAEALKKADEAYSQRDFIMMLEYLLPYAAKNKDRVDLNLRLGQAYRGLRLYQASHQYLQLARSSRPDDAEVNYQLGMVSADFQRWDAANTYLKKADEAGHPQKQQIQYHLGYVAYRRGLDYKAREHMGRSLWHDEDEELARAAKAMLRRWDSERLWVAKLRFSSLYDTNIFRKPNSEPAPKDIGAAKGAGLTFDLGLAARAFQSPSGNFNFGFDFSYLSWFSQELKAVDTGYQKLYTGFNFNVGEKENPWLLIDSQIYLSSTIVGGQRTTDGLGFSTGFTFLQMMLEPEIFFDTAMHVDPLPNRDDGLDPFLWEVVAPSDRSARVIKIGVGTLLAKDLSSSWRARFTNSNVKHSAKLIEIDDYSENRIDIAYDLQYTTRWEWGMQSHLGNRSFSKSPDGRKDTFLAVRGVGRYYQSPFFSYDGWLATQYQTSSRSANKYTKFILGLGAQIDL